VFVHVVFVSKGVNDMRHILLSDLKGIEKKTLEMLRENGIETLEDLKLVQIEQLSAGTGLPETLLRETLLRAELHAYNVPPDLADVLVASEKIGRAGELAAFDVDAIQMLWADSNGSGRKLALSPEVIETVLEQVPNLTLDEETTRGAWLEDSAVALYDEAEPALRAEEPMVSAEELEALAELLDGTVQKLAGGLRSMETGGQKQIEFSNVQALLSSLQADIQNASAQILAKVEPDIGIVLSEDEAPAFSDEELDLDAQVLILSQQLIDMQEQLADAKLRRTYVDEELSPAMAIEEDLVFAREE
jgi:hypothetical protein